MWRWLYFRESVAFLLFHRYTHQEVYLKAMVQKCVQGHFTDIGVVLFDLKFLEQLSKQSVILDVWRDILPEIMVGPQNKYYI